MSINEEVLLKVLSIVEATTDEFRQELNKRIHVADISYNAMKASAPRLTPEQHEKLIKLFVNKFGLKDSSIKEAVLYLVNTKGASTRLWYNPSTGDAALIAGTYETLQKNISSVLKEASQLKSFNSASLNRFTGVDKSTGNTITNIGHISANHTNFTSPLEEQIQYTAETLLSILPINSPIVSKVASELNKLRKLHKAEATFELTRYNDLTSKDLAKLVVVVTVQSAKINGNFAKTEQKIAKNLTDYIRRPSVLKAILNTKGSNSILEDIRERLVVAMGGKKTSGSTHSTKAPTKKSLDMLVGPGKVSSFQGIPALKDPTSGKFIQKNLTNLTSLLNFHLHDVVAANMGDGNRRDILNYRTGRFATSTKVERVTQSREGMISAFYSYMRNPYGTFSTDGRQQFPKTRDPKLLISKSIREIGTKIGIERMRAVLV